jgi:hypothetical protein
MPRSRKIIGLGIIAGGVIALAIIALWPFYFQATPVAERHYSPPAVPKPVTTTTIPATTTIPHKIVLPIKPHKIVVRRSVPIPTTTTIPPVVIHPAAPRKETSSPPRTTIPQSPTTTMHGVPPPLTVVTPSPTTPLPNQCAGPNPPYPCSGYWIPNQT